MVERRIHRALLDIGDTHSQTIAADNHELAVAGAELYAGRLRALNGAVGERIVHGVDAVEAALTGKAGEQLAGGAFGFGRCPMGFFDRDHGDSRMTFDLLLERGDAGRSDAFVHAAGDDGDLRGCTAL